MRNSEKNKIYFAVFIWLALCLAAFGFLFKKLNASNIVALEEITALKKQKGVLEAEKESYTLAKNDLQKLSAEKIQPENFFSRDITLVNEIRRLEGIAKDLKIDMNLSGVAGTLRTLRPAGGVKSEIFQIPFTMNVKGSLASVVSFMEYLENLEFLTSVNNVNISSAGQGGVNANFSAVFYLKK
ncbi:MAG: hypothetical protein UZ12_BCD005000603 [Bacteroidetes bacterium OLB12]|nr:MAG: hypothetical protein UZ12_BCD005000603 [Bacteroidetes bacterium OLB12]